MPEMVDVGEKEVVHRTATATGAIRLRRETIAAIQAGAVEKGNVLEIAAVATIQGAKRAGELIPLCHPLRLTAVKPAVEVSDEGVTIRCTVEARERTGVEMEALLGVSLGLLTVWDMVKGLEKDAAGQYPDTRVETVRVEEKRVARGD